MAISPSSTRPDAALLALRPAIADQLPANAPFATVADFQHQVLRPLLKLQHGVLLATVADFAHEYRLPLHGSEAEIGPALEELLARNTRLRATIMGLVVGLLTEAEMAFYRQHRPELNRRLLDLAQQRLRSSLADLRFVAEA
ncbi:MAG: hypothetical protein EOO56_08665 [Hymenobacter sp.]|nr:MAG: hypothetical protein EOO56_08665 [Hymenobacter sp.]